MSKLTFSVALVLSALTLSGARQQSIDRNTNFIDDPKSASTIDFSRSQPGPDGTVCVQRKKYIDKTEKDQLKECFLQNVTQCYYTYITEYSEGVQEKCEDVYWKTCKIVFKERVFNATARLCKRPLVKRCNQEAKAEPKIVCETFFETECNTTTVVPAPGDEPLEVTFCDKIPRKICAPDNCNVVEAPEACADTEEESMIQHPVEICDLQPQKHCSEQKISVPRLIPEQKCREVEKEICNTRLVNPHDTKQPVYIKYCTRPDTAQAGQPYQPTYSSTAPQPVRTAESTFRRTLPNQPFGIRDKRQPEWHGQSAEPLDQQEVHSNLPKRKESREGR